MLGCAGKGVKLHAFDKTAGTTRDYIWKAAILERVEYESKNVFPAKDNTTGPFGIEPHPI
jgi:hypothetical protein